MSDEFELPEETNTEELSQEEEKEVFDLLDAARRTYDKSIFGHDIRIQTLSVGDEIRAFTVTKDYKDTDGVFRAFKAGIVAACIVSIDGEPLYTSISKRETEAEEFAKKFDRILKYHSSFVDEVYVFFNECNAEIAKLIEKLGKSAG